jgi:hypothetical protein
MHQHNRAEVAEKYERHAQFAIIDQETKSYGLSFLSSFLSVSLTNYALDHVYCATCQLTSSEDRARPNTRAARP